MLLTSIQNTLKYKMSKILFLKIEEVYRNGMKRVCFFVWDICLWKL